MISKEPTRHVAFIRNIMVGRSGLSAELLRHSVEEAGGTSPRSHLATGNVAFTAPRARVAAIAASLEEAIASVIGRKEEVFVRLVESLARAVEADPFKALAADDVYERCVTFISADTPLTLRLPVETPNGDTLLFAASPGQILSITRRIKGRPGQPGRVIESALNVRASTRNWNTIERITKIEYPSSG